jgi:16S rRNA C1402 N4-methylase RsmH
LKREIEILKRYGENKKEKEIDRKIEVLRTYTRRTNVSKTAVSIYIYTSISLSSI